MDDRLARRDLAIAAVVVVGLSRLLEPPARLGSSRSFLLGAMLFGTLQVLADEAPPAERRMGVPIESLILPSVAAVACLGAIRLVPFGLWLVAGPARSPWLLVGRTLALEARINRGHGGPDRRTTGRRVLVTILLVGFLAFTGIAAMVPGGLVQPGVRRRGAARDATCSCSPGRTRSSRSCSATARRRCGSRTCATRSGSALTYAIAIAIGAAALRAMEIPRLIGPALLTLLFYLWDAFAGAHAVPPPRAAAGSGRSACSRARPRRRRLEPAAARLSASRRRGSPRDRRRLTSSRRTVLQDVARAVCASPRARPRPITTPTLDLAAPRKDDRLVTFPDVETNRPEPRQPDPPEAPAGRPGDRPGDGRRSGPRPRPRTASCSSSGPDAEAENRLAKSLWELGELGAAREHYQTALALDPTNRIAERNIDRLKMLLVAAGEKTVPAQAGSKAPVSIFVEETGKTGFAFLTDLARPARARPGQPGRRGRADARGQPPHRASATAMRIGVVEPRVAARLLKLMADGNKYAAGVTSLGDKDVRIIIREVFQDPRNYGKVSFPTAAKSTDLRPYTKGTLVREEMDLEEDLEDDEEDEEIEDLDRVLPPEATTDEAFEDEPDELDEP